MNHVATQFTFAIDIVERAPVAVAPTVNALLHIPHNETLIPSIKTVLQEWQEVPPLQFAGVLKLINHDVLIARSGSLIDKGDVAIAHHVAQEVCRISQDKAVGLLVLLAEGFIDGVKQHHFIDVREHHPCRDNAHTLGLHPFEQVGVTLQDILTRKFALHRHVLAPRIQAEGIIRFTRTHHICKLHLARKV